LQKQWSYRGLNDDIPLTEQSVVGPLVAYDAINCFKTGLMGGHPHKRTVR